MQRVSKRLKEAVRSSASPVVEYCFAGSNPAALRRCLLVLLVALSGCAAYQDSRRADQSGTVTVTWSFEQSFVDDRCGEALRLGPGHYLIRLKGKPPSFNDSGHCIFHEFLHAMGGSH